MSLAKKPVGALCRTWAKNLSGDEIFETTILKGLRGSSVRLGAHQILNLKS